METNTDITLEEKFADLATLAIEIRAELLAITPAVTVTDDLKSRLRSCAALFEDLTGIYSILFFRLPACEIPRAIVVGVCKQMSSNRAPHLQDAVDLAHFYNKERLLRLATMRPREIPEKWVKDTLRFLAAISSAITENLQSRTQGPVGA